MVKREDVEQALDSHELWVRVYARIGITRYWQCRRNGSTKRWIKDADRFRIPIKAGIYVYGAITETSDVGEWYNNTQEFVICASDPNVLIEQARKAWEKRQETTARA